MLYNSNTNTIICTVAPGNILSDGETLTISELEKIALWKGQSCNDGPIDMVALVFFSEGEATPFMNDIKRLGLECRAYVDGLEKVILEGVRREENGDELLLPVIRERSWPHRDGALYRELLDNAEQSGSPIVTYAYDSPTAIRGIITDSLGRSVEELDMEALQNLAGIEYSISEITPGTYKVSGEYAAEQMLLLPEISRKVAAHIGESHLCVAAPTEGAVLVAPMMSDMVNSMIQWNNQTYSKAEGRRIYPHPFIVMDGVVCGFTQAESKSTQLIKGETINLTKEHGALQKVIVGLGWDLSNYKGSADFDLDATAFLLDKNGCCLGEEYVVFYNNLRACNGTVVHTGDNPIGGSDGDDEEVILDLPNIPQSVEKIAFAITIHEAEQRNQTFGQISEGYVRLVNQSGGLELSRFTLGQESANKTALIACELYREGEAWLFKATSEPCEGGLAGLCRHYGLTV